MTAPLDRLEPLPPEQRLALAWSTLATRERLASVLVLDRRLARIVARTREPMLGQMRLAWWRDALGKPLAERPRGDAVLDTLGRLWEGQEAALIVLVDGWERVLEEPPLSESAARGFAAGRCMALLAAHDRTGSEDGPRDPSHEAAWRWSLADFASRVSDEGERALLVRLGLEQANAASRPARGARGLAVLGALGARALRRGGRPLMEGRGAPLAAFRAALFGR